MTLLFYITKSGQLSPGFNIKLNVLTYHNSALLIPFGLTSWNFFYLLWPHLKHLTLANCFQFVDFDRHFTKILGLAQRSRRRGWHIRRHVREVILQNQNLHMINILSFNTFPDYLTTAAIPTVSLQDSNFVWWAIPAVINSTAAIIIVLLSWLSILFKFGLEFRYFLSSAFPVCRTSF